MSSSKIPIVHWERPAPTKYDLDYADLTSIDLSLYDKPEGCEKLVETIRHALTEVGFWVVTNTGFTQEEVDHQFALGQTFFEQSLEEKNSNRCNFEEGGYFGYRGAYERTVYGTDVKDNMELINIPKVTAEYEKEPKHRLVQENKEVIGDFTRRCWYNVARKLFVLFALALELPEDYFVKIHDYKTPSEDHLRYVRASHLGHFPLYNNPQSMYHPRTKEEDEKVMNLWAWAHTDYGSLTLLFSQNVSGLQIKTPEGEYKDVRPIDGSIVVNIADTMSFITKGYLKSTIHRVHRPPPDQDHIDRVGVIYMCRPNNNALIRPAPSPLLRRLGLVTPADEADETEVTALEYIQARVKRVHASKTYGTRADAGEKFKHKHLEIVENFAEKTDNIDALSVIAAAA
ncbi:Clavaminate synthase-like protein [Cylindrobasidium torrendii FP15055 ss-10]|uniref:Clavaminate synthase-like protein n=1 Tax=Cylindrobasidium torrendii FP15055 ss-10 TaxID=1314674 RepID=A0A0D7BAE7_9AGAR|nr:Clavaminate synthase-like protein [Cylindrobasidium torrendii FP15055 ss-10]